MTSTLVVLGNVPAAMASRSDRSGASSNPTEPGAATLSPSASLKGTSALWAHRSPAARSNARTATTKRGSKLTLGLSCCWLTDPASAGGDPLASGASVFA